MLRYDMTNVFINENIYTWNHFFVGKRWLHHEADQWIVVK